jgi:hypothetical protein
MAQISRSGMRPVRRLSKQCAADRIQRGATSVPAQN